MDTRYQYIKMSESYYIMEDLRENGTLSYILARLSPDLVI